jgi:hypothetical protein
MPGSLAPLPVHPARGRWPRSNHAHRPPQDPTRQGHVVRAPIGAWRPPGSRTYRGPHPPGLLVAQHGGRRQPHGETLLHVPADDEQLRRPSRGAHADPPAAPAQRTHPHRPHGPSQDRGRAQIHRGRLGCLHETAQAGHGGPEISNGSRRGHLAALDYYLRRTTSYRHGQRPRVQQQPAALSVDSAGHRPPVHLSLLSAL